MALRKIIEIDEEKCNGCGQCIVDCAEAALQIVNGKAKLIKEIYCDGLGACLGSCPAEALAIVEREAEAFDEDATEEHMKEESKMKEGFCGCAGTKPVDFTEKTKAGNVSADEQPELQNWPIQLKLVGTAGAYVNDADILLAADCTAFSAVGFHSRFIKGKKVLIGCPKLDNAQQYFEQLTGLFKDYSIKSVSVVPIGFLPKDNQNTFNIVVSMPETTSVEDTDRLVREVTAVLAQEPHVANWQTWIGQAGVADFNGLFQGTAARTGGHVDEIRVNLVDKHDRTQSSIDIVRELRPKLEPIREAWPGAEVALGEQPPGPPLRSTVLAELYGPDTDGLRALSAQVQEAFAQTYDIVDITDTEPEDVLEHRIVSDKDKAALSGVATAQIAEALALVYGGTTLSRAHLADEKLPVPIRAFVPRRFEVDPDRLAVTVVLGMAPGGIAEMAITAKVLQLGVPLVTALHVTRLVALLLLTAPVFRHARRLRRRSGR